MLLRNEMYQYWDKYSAYAYVWILVYHQTTNISSTFVGNEFVDHSDAQM